MDSKQNGGDRRKINKLGESRNDPILTTEIKQNVK